MTPPPYQDRVGMRAEHPRESSTNAGSQQNGKGPKRTSAAPQSEMIHFTALVRLPFARGDFVDPPQVEWNATKDRALWKIISQTPKTSDLDWDHLAEQFQVSPKFMLQQAAWLYERHLSHVRAQMRRVGSANTGANTGAGSYNAPSGSMQMRRLGSGGGLPRAPSALSLRSKDSPTPRGDTPTTPRAIAPPLSRTPSTTTVTQSKVNVAQPLRKTSQRSARSSHPPHSASPSDPSSDIHGRPASPSSPSAISDSSSSASSDSDTGLNPIRRSQLFKRPPRFKSRKTHLSRVDDQAEDAEEEEDEESESEGVFLPFANHLRKVPTSGGPSREKAREQSDPSTSPTPDTESSGHHLVKSMTSSASSPRASAPPDAAVGRAGPSRVHRHTTHSNGPPPGPLSPRHRAELARASTRQQQKGKGRDGSEGTPSMGSSFSDLDDASITQSALEEALLSNIQHGRMSTFSQLRSRLL